MAKTIVEVLQGVIDELAALRADVKAIEARLTVQGPTPMPPTVQSIWDGLSIDDPLAAYRQTDAGWLDTTRRFVDFPGDMLMLDTCWAGVEPPTGRVMHGGNLPDMKRRRELALNLHALDLKGHYEKTDFAQANISPEVAACLILLKFVGPDWSGLGSNASRSPAAWANLTDLQSLFNRLRDLSAGTGTPSGGQ